jgi:UDP-N-acetylmuramyl pentapeptide phosphotransferase/UDP-N-acetylglucosamine-1-phosphate transferase
MKAFVHKYEIIIHSFVFFAITAVYLYFPPYEVPQVIYWLRMAVSVIYGIIGIIFIYRSFDEAHKGSKTKSRLLLRGVLFNLMGGLIMNLDLINNALETGE